MASIQKTAKGYRAQVKLRGVRDSQLFRTKREAEAWASQRETEIREADGKAPGERHSLRFTLERYRDEVTPTKRSHHWERKRIDFMLRDELLPLDTAVSEVTPEHLEAWAKDRRKKVKASTVLRDYVTLGAVFTHARKVWRWIEASPVTDAPKPSQAPHKDVVISRPQIRRMLRALGYSRGGPIREMRQAVGMCFLVALRTGMRAGELCGLTWDRVHVDRCELPLTKNGEARKVPLDYRAAATIERMRGFDERLVFGVTAQSLDAQFRKYRKRAGLAGFTFHDTRHTAATRLARRINVLDLCKMFGWKNPKQAMVYYNPTASDIAAQLNRRPGRGLSRQ
jgi:integrase